MIKTLKQNKELWDLFTKREEYNSLILDQYDRFPYYLSTHRNVLEPKVSEFLIENGLDVEYPKGKKFAVCLTHDIDVVYPYTSKLSVMFNAVKSLKECQIKNAFTIPFSNINKNWNPWWNLKEIMA
ncbi:hypothetical protein M1O47_04355, partial [Dehalococcoidia bacterium]|nr:hypothetical protein [Dehalococcoidia bacterium]